MKKHAFSRIKRHLAYSHKRIKNIPRKNVISRFADKNGLLYFGSVNPQNDEYKVIKGFTVSSTHKDDHFCVGTVGGYDISLVDRSDFYYLPDSSGVHCDWLILALELKNNTSIPHFFVSASNTDKKPFTKLHSASPNLKEIDLNAYETYGLEFTSRFSVYSKPIDAQGVQSILGPDVTRVLSAHFWPLSIEQQDSVLYIYSTNKKITSDLLGSMLKNGLWLAGQIDKSTDIND